MDRIYVKVNRLIDLQQSLIQFQNHSTCLLQAQINKLQTSKKQFKSKQISFDEHKALTFNKIQINGPETVPEYVTSLKIYPIIKQCFEKRPCWLRNVLEYELRRKQFIHNVHYTTNELKNILRLLCFTYRDGPWKHVFCRYGYNPLIIKQSTMFQSVVVKIKCKQVEDYEDQDNVLTEKASVAAQHQSNVNVNVEVQKQIYDPTLRQIPSKYMRIYQLCDIEDKRIEQSIKTTAALASSCTKQNGWFSKNQFVELQRIIRTIRQQRSKN